jgi:hypothetical protein
VAHDTSYPAETATLVLVHANAYIKSEYSAKTMNWSAINQLIKQKNGRPACRVKGFSRYRHVEYLNSSIGLIVPAHQENDQVDGIHPASISESVKTFTSIVEPLTGAKYSGERYSCHWLNRRLQGSLVLAAYGRMIDQGDPEAILLTPKHTFRMHVYMTAHGPVVVVEDREEVHVIARHDELAKMNLAELPKAA